MLLLFLVHDSQLWPDYSVAPGLMIAATDTKHYLHLTDAVYRFLPVLFGKNDPSRLHGPNERIHMEAYEKLLNFYFHVLRNSQDKFVLPSAHGHNDL
eukprot:m.39700 g.39700  ORF g.39700 m.39700 type:complete len:97 (-) comp10344_c0_seq4:191-481(-)